jgi:hypothetical protein
VATAGKRLCLLDGTYQGSASTIQPPLGLSGTSGNPIAIQAFNDGGATIDGQFVRIPIYLSSNNWWVIEGVNAKNGGGNVALLYNSNNNVMRRLVLWDADATKNVDIITHYNASNNVWEDYAAFGTGRSPWSVYSGNNNTLRRGWVRWEGSVSQVGAAAMFTAYGGAVPSIAVGTLVENVLGTWNPISMPQEYDLTDTSGNIKSPTQHFTNYTPYGNQVGAKFILRSAANPGENSQLRLFGCLAYLQAGDRLNAQSSPNQIIDFRDANQQTIKDCFVMVPPDHADAASIRGFNIANTPGTGNSLDHITSVSNNDYLGNAAVTNYVRGDTIASVPNPWTSTGPGANLCFQYVNGVKTSTPMWPWPMNDRIKAATEASGQYSGPCSNCIGGRGTRTATDVTTTVESLLGTIPSQCRAR